MTDPTEDLADALDDLTDAGAWTPCASDPWSWITDTDTDARATAARACAACPVLRECWHSAVYEVDGTTVRGGRDLSTPEARAEAAGLRARMGWPAVPPHARLPHTRRDHNTATTAA